MVNLYFKVGVSIIMKKVVFILSVSLAFFSVLPVSWAIDPNINTASTDLRSNGADGNPGFNPCLGGTNTNGVCGGIGLSASALLSSENLTLFRKLGPGAVTDNMFGFVRQPLSPGTCGAEGANAVSEAISTKLNCGNVFFNPTNQGQTGLAGANDLSATAAPLAWNTSLSADFCANAGTDCVNGAQVVAAHTGFNVVNNFTWDLVSTTSANVVSSQTIEQTTALKTTGIGTCCGSVNAGTGDQWFKMTSAFTVVSNNSDQFVGVQPTITWTMNIEDPDQSGTGSGKFSQSISGSFVRNTGTFTSVQYPDGQSQSNQSSAATLP